MSLPLDTCVHEAGHAIVADHFQGPCLKGITVREDGYGEVAVSAAWLRASPLEQAAYALAGGIAERMLTSWASDPNPSSHDWELVHQAYLDWSGGSTRELERRAFVSAAARTARGILHLRWGELVQLSETLAEGGDIPGEYLAPSARRSTPLNVEADAGAPGDRTEVKTLRELQSDAFISRLEANSRRVYGISGPVAPRQAWGVT